MIHLRPFQKNHLDKTWHWMNNPKVAQPFGRSPRLSKKKHEAWFKNLKKDPTQAVFAVTKDGEHIGNAGLKHIDRRHRSAEVWVYIGDRNRLRKGYGEKTVRLLSRCAFQRLKLHRLQAWMLESNLASVRLFRKCGFKEEGRLREAFLGNGRFHDLRLLARVGR